MSETQSATTVGHAILARLRDAGIEYFLANAGTDFPPIIEAFAQSSGENASGPEPLRNHSISSCVSDQWTVTGIERRRVSRSTPARSSTLFVYGACGETPSVRRRRFGSARRIVRSAGFVRASFHASSTSR